LGITTHSRKVTLLVEKLQRAGNEVRDVGTAQMTRARSSVEVTLDGRRIPMDHNLRVGGSSTQAPGVVEGPQPLRSFAFVLQQLFFGQRVRESESNEVFRSFAFNVREIAARMNTAAVRVNRRILDARGPQFVTDAVQSPVVGFGQHECRLGKPSSRSNGVLRFPGAPARAVAQTSVCCIADFQSTASGISMPWKVRSQRIGNPRYGRLESCATKLRRLTQFRRLSHALSDFGKPARREFAAQAD
jgi:hypothetical protein